MNSLRKKLTLLCLFTILVTCMVQVDSTRAQVASSSATQSALSFISDVVQPDLSKYNVTLVNDIVGQTPTKPIETQESVDYHLSEINGVGNGIDVICIFTNDVLTYAQLSNTASSPFYSSLSTSVPAAILATLDGYQTYSGKSLQNMISALTNTDLSQNISSVVGDIHLTTQNDPNEVDISLMYTANGTDYTGINLSFRNGQFYTFSDDRSLWVIGNTDVNINESQAIEIAQQYVKTYSYTTDNGTLVHGFRVSSIQAVLGTYPVDNTTTIEPYWRLQLNLAEIYPGNVYALSFGVWANSGIVFLAQPVGVEGGSPQTISSSPQRTTAQVKTGFSILELGSLTGLVTVAAIAGIAIVIKKRSK